MYIVYYICTQNTIFVHIKVYLYIIYYICTHNIIFVHSILYLNIIYYFCTHYIIYKFTHIYSTLRYGTVDKDWRTNYIKWVRYYCSTQSVGLFDGVWRLFQQYFSYIVAVSFVGGGNQRTRRKLPTCWKSLTNFIT